jgi:hypothetical protein
MQTYVVGTASAEPQDTVNFAKKKKVQAQDDSEVLMQSEARLFSHKTTDSLHNYTDLPYRKTENILPI